ncbi:MAG: glycosyltransferase family 2 protein [Pelagibacteraceae bacterium]|nr:glycosyltransferase family 2 protein [Pelagibacteraceae bacterium]MBO6487504.1 glycosyltransferase family 2 protein [Pelagibacteraceae bacterium]
MKLNISLYIPVYNGESTIESVLKSALQLDPGADEIIVIDDGSNDQTKEILKKYKNKIKIIKNETNQGLGFSRNLAISKSKHQLVASIDADVEPEKKWLLKLYETQKKFGSAICGGRLFEKYKDKNIYNMWRHIHGTQNPFGDKIIENLGDTVSGSNTLLNKEVWSNVGGYLNQYKTNGEDVTFCRKLVISKYKISYNGTAECNHLQNDNLKSLCNRARRAYVYGGGLKEPTILRFIQRSIRHSKFCIRFSLKDFINLRFSLIYINFIMLFNHVIKEFLGLIHKKKDYI